MRYYLVVFLLIFSGCSASWHIKRAETKEPGIFKTDIQIEYRDTIIHLDTIFTLDVSDFLEIDTLPNIVYEKEYIDKVLRIYPSFDTIIKSEKGLTAKIWMRKGVLKANFEVDSSLIFHLKDSIVILNKVITEKNTIKIEKETPFKQYFVYLIIILALGFLIVLFKRK